MQAGRSLAVVVILALAALAAPAAWAEQERVLPTLKLTVRIPDDWAVRATDDHGDQFDYVHGGFIGTVHALTAPCAEALAILRARATEPIVEATGELAAGWSGYFRELPGLLSTDTRRKGLFCRDVGGNGTTRAVAVEAFDAELAALVAVIDAAVERKLAESGATATAPAIAPPARPPSARPSLLARVRPRRYELGVTMLDVGTDDFLTSERGAGANLEISRPIYGVGPALGYRVRLQPTSAGVAGFAEVGAGISFKYLSLLGVAGVGGAGDSAPFGGHYGGQADLLIPLGFVAGLEASASYAWCTGGTTTRIDGRVFVKPSLLSRRGFTFGIGWEQRVDSRIITINGGVMRVPDF